LTTFSHNSQFSSEAWKLHKVVLKEFLRDFTSESSLAPALHAALQKPFRDHIQSYLQLLSQLQGQLQEGSEQDVVAAVIQEFGKLESFISQVLDEACFTKELWKSLGYKFTDVLCVPERRLLEDSRNLPISSGSSRSERLLLFDDVLVLIQGNSFQSFDLKLVWVERNRLQDCEYNLRITTPEETFVLSAKDPQMKAVWRWKLEQAVRQALNGKRDFPLWGRSGEGSEAPARRFFTYVFRTEGRLRGATYEGEWLWGKPHGKWMSLISSLPWFSTPVEIFPIKSNIPRLEFHPFSCRYGSDLVYKGYFKDNVRQGFGILENFSAEHPFKYTGQWENDKKNGYGVWEDKERGERYIGMWLDDQRHGEGIVVAQSGLCYQRTFHADKMVVSPRFPWNLEIPGMGNSPPRVGLRFHSQIHPGVWGGLLDGGNPQEFWKNPHFVFSSQLGLKEFPVEKRWTGIFEQFLEFLQSGCKEEMEESFTGFHIQSSKELRKSQEYLFCQRELGPLCSLESMEILEFSAIPGACAAQGETPPTLEQLFQNSRDFHSSPTGCWDSSSFGNKLSLKNQKMTNPCFCFSRGLLQLALEQKGQVPSEEGDSRLKGSSLVLPLILPTFYPELSMLYMLQHQREDDLYCQGIVELSLFSDIQLLEFLDVQKHLWPLKDLTLTSNQRHSLVKDKCFLSATECLQKLITTVDPREKLEILRKTYEELEHTVSRLLEKEFRLPMDDLLPLLMFVVSRAKIQHLGAEIHLIRDLMDPTNQGGMLDFLLTALEVREAFPGIPA
ncbi:AL2CL protein, partial [Erithacus rubecula]|nr:AL2CL protein [Erithacus rubecula]